MARRRERERKAREDFRASKKQDVFSLVGALGGSGAAKPGLKMAFGRGKISMSTILNHGKGKESIGQAGHAHLLNMSDGSVLKTGTKSREWDLKHSSLTDTISRASSEIEQLMAKGENTKLFDELEHPPRRPTEHLSFQLKELEKRGPANTLPRPQNQFGHQCVVPAFTQIEKIKKVTDLCEYITITEPREQEQAAAAIARAAQNMKKRREANALMKMMREQAAERKRAAEKQRREEEAAQAAAEEAARLEALRREAESPATQEARALFDEIDEDGSGALDRDEIRVLAKRLGKKLTNAKLDAAMAEMDADGNGDVDFDEFLSWWKQTGSKGFLAGLTFNFLKRKKAEETEADRAELLAPEPVEEAYFDTFKRERAEAEQRLLDKKAEQHAVSRRIMDNAGSLQAVGSLGVAGEDGKFASRMTGAFGDFKLGADVVTGHDRGRSLRVSTRALVAGPAAHARTMGMSYGGHVPQPPPK
jgi:calmodulin